MHRFLAPALLLAFTSVILADELRGKVVSIADGDTITVLDDDKKQHKVRLTGIDDLTGTWLADSAPFQEVT